MNNNDIINNIRDLNKEAIKEILLYKDKNQQKLFDVAQEIRNSGRFGRNVELRSVIEISNICSQKCRYCSMGNRILNPYVLDNTTIISNIKKLISLGRKTFLLQSGENSNQKFIDNISYCCEKITALYPDIKIILCLGNLKKYQYIQLKNSGAKRYILKFETSNPYHHKFCRPTDTIKNRLENINTLIELGFQVGSGNIIGLPNQTIDYIIEDLILIDKLKLDMVSATKFIPNESSAFANYKAGNIDLTLNFLAVLRILKPNCLIPSTSSLSTIDEDGQLKGLRAGCNTLTIHDGTPYQYQKNYSIYSENRFSPGEQYCREIIKQCGLIPQSSLL